MVATKFKRKQNNNEYIKIIFKSLGIFSCTTFICCKVATMGRRKLYFYVMSATYPEFVTKNTQWSVSLESWTNK